MNKVAVVTGGVQGIGKCICQEFEKLGVKVCVIDIQDNPYFVGDISKKEVLESYSVRCCISYFYKEKRIRSNDEG